MNDIFSKVALFKAEIPFVFWSAVCFYLLLAAIVLTPSLRRRFRRYFAPTIPSTGEHIAFLDVIKGAAILAVASFHAWQWLVPFNNEIGIKVVRQGFHGIAVFAILSGFLLCNSLIKSEPEPSKLKWFYISRFLRIYPLFLVTALYALVMGYVERGALSPQDVLADIFMLKVFSYPRYINPPAWFLYVLVLFYIVLPVWYIVAGRFRLHTAVIALVVFSFISETSPRELHLMRYFILGAVTSEVAFRLKGLKKEWGYLFLALGIFLCSSEVFYNKDLISNGLSAAFGSVGLHLNLDTKFTSLAFGYGFALALLGMLRMPEFFNRLSVFPLRFIGVISYSIYMWHGIVIASDFPIYFDGHNGVTKMLTAPSVYGDFFSLVGLYFPAFILVATVSYAVIERPFLRFIRDPNA